MGKMLWKPSEERVRNSNMYRFMSFVNDRHEQTFTDYDGLYAWSVNHIPEFWAAVWDFVGINASRGYDRVIDNEHKMPGAKWFPGARLNFAENLLRFRDDSVALIFKGEDHPTVKMTYAELYDEVARLAKSLKACGVGPGDRVAGFMPNMPEAVTAMLAATSMGRCGPPVPPISGSRVSWIVSGRSNRRFSSWPTATSSRGRTSIPSPAWRRSSRIFPRSRRSSSFPIRKTSRISAACAMPSIIRISGRRKAV